MNLVLPEEEEEGTNERSKADVKQMLQYAGEGRRRVPQLKWRWQERGLAPGGPRVFLREEEEPGGGGGGGGGPHPPSQPNHTYISQPAPINYRWVGQQKAILCVIS